MEDDAQENYRLQKFQEVVEIFLRVWEVASEVFLAKVEHLADLPEVHKAYEFGIIALGDQFEGDNGWEEREQIDGEREKKLLCEHVLLQDFKF